MSNYLGPTRGVATVVGGSSAGAGESRHVEYQGRRVTLILQKGAEDELNRLVLDGVTMHMLLEVFASAVQNNVLNENVTVERVNLLSRSIARQDGISRRSAIANIERNPGHYFGGRSESHAAVHSPFNPGPQTFPYRPSRLDPHQFIPLDQRQGFSNRPAREGGNPFDMSRPTGRGQNMTGGGSTEGRK